MATPNDPYLDNSTSPKSKFIDLSTPAGKRKFWLITSASILVVLTVVGVIVLAARPNAIEPGPSESPTPVPTPTPEPITMASMLDGTIGSTDLAKRHPLAIMIENTIDARPQAGLGDASLIYEAITEGGITRFMAVYAPKIPAKAGPVRSARSVFVDFAQEFIPNSAYYAHVGGSPEALGKISGDGVYDLNQFSIGAKAFQRFPRAGVASEHTMFTFPDKLYEVAKSLGYKTESTFRPWKFKEDTDITNRPEAQTITIPFTSKTYEVKYVYAKESNNYRRYMGGVEHKDANNGVQISARNVIVEYVDYQTADAKGRQKVQVIGEGKAKIFTDGKVIEAKWKKEHSPTRTLYYDATSGEEIQFNRGQTFIELVKKDSAITVQ